MRRSLPRGLGVALALSLVLAGFSAFLVSAQTTAGPSVTIESPADGAEVEGSVEITGTASDTNDSVQQVEIRIDGGAWNTASGTSSWSYTWDSTTVSDGQHTITARATNSTGSTAWENHTVTVDNTNEPPTVSISSPNEGETVSGSVQVTGTASDPDGSVQVVEVRIDGGAWNATDGTSSWSYTWDTTTLADGQHTIEARSSDGSAHSSIASRTVTVDNQNEPPTVAIDSPAEGATVSGSVDVTGTASDPDGSVQVVEVRIDGGAWQAASGTSSWSFTWDSTSVGDGQHTIEARSSDGSAHSSIASRTVTVDNQADGGSTDQVPSVTIENPADGATVKGSVVIEGTASDPENNLQAVEVRIDGGTWQPASGTQSWTYTWDTTQAAEGQHTIEARSYDGSNHSPVDKHLVTVDNQGTSDANSAPSIQIDQPSPGATVSETITIRGSASDSDGSVSFVLVRIDDSDWREASGTLVWDRAWDTTTLTNGDHVIYAKAYDNDGSISLTSRSITVDNQAPTQTSTGGNETDDGNQTDENDPPTVSFDQPTEGAEVEGRITIRGTAAEPDPGENVTLVQVRIGERQWKNASGTGSWSYTWDTTTVEPGEHTIQARASDGQAWGPIANVTVTVAVPEEALQSTSASGNGTAPTLSLESPEEGTSATGELTLAGTVEDPDAGDDGNGTLEVHARVDGGQWEIFEVEPGEPFEVTLDLGGLTPGDHTVDIRASDGESYSQTQSVTFEVAGGAPQVVAGIFVVLLALGGVGLWIWSRQGSSA